MDEESKEKKSNVENEEYEDTLDESKVEDIEDEWEDILGSGSIMKRILKEGIPESRPQRYQICEINYEAYLETGIEVAKENNYSIQLADCDIIQGLDLAIGLMNIGEKCELLIAARLAYGSKGLSPLIPGDSNMIFRVELLSAKDEDDPETLSIRQRNVIGNKKRERGNWWYGRGEHTLAIQCYRRALDYLDELEGGVKDISDQQEVSDGELQKLLEDRLSVCNNMAAAQMKLGLNDPALNSLENVLRCQPHNVKALYRKAKIYKGKNDFSAALKLLQKANNVSNDDLDVQKEITSLNLLIKKQKTSEKELAQRMFNMKDDIAQRKRKKIDSKVQAWTFFGASVAIGLIGLAMYKYKYV